MEELSRTQYRITLILCKYIPWIIAFIYFVCSIFSCFGIGFRWIGFLSSLSVLPAICLISFSVLFRFCIWHRLPIYYIFTQNIINAIDFYIGIPVTNIQMCWIYLIITGIFVLLGAYLKNRYNEKIRTSQK